MRSMSILLTRIESPILCDPDVPCAGTGRAWIKGEGAVTVWAVLLASACLSSVLTMDMSLETSAASFVMPPLDVYLEATVEAISRENREIELSADWPIVVRRGGRLEGAMRLDGCLDERGCLGIN